MIIGKTTKKLTAQLTKTIDDTNLKVNTVMTMYLRPTNAVDV